MFVTLPTGSGKSLCYAILPFAFDDTDSSIALIVSPLKTLMKDHFDGDLSFTTYGLIITT